MSVPPPPPGFFLDPPAGSQTPPPPPGFDLDTDLSLKARWRRAKNNPEQRAVLAKQIGQQFAKESYGPKAKAYGPTAGGRKPLISVPDPFELVGDPAFLKTALDTGAFGLGRRKIQQKAREVFPGMTVEESRMVAQEIERLQFEMKPGTTAAGGVAGIGASMLGGVGALRGAGAAVSKLPSAARSFIQQNASKLAFRKATPTPAQRLAGERVTGGQRAANVGLNLARGGAAGAGGAAAYEAVGAERNPLEAPGALALGAALGAGAPPLVAGVSSVVKRQFFPKAKAKDILEDVIGPQAGVLARQYQEATGEALPVAAAALDPNTAARIAPFFPGMMDGAMAADVASDAMRKAARERIARDLPAGVRETAEKLAGQATGTANRFMETLRQQGAGGIETSTITRGLNQVLDVLRPTLGGKLVPLVNMINTKSRDSRKAIPGELSLDDYEAIRRSAVKLAGDSLDPDVLPRVRELFRDPAGELLPKVERLFPGYDDAILSGYSRQMDVAGGAELAPRAFSETPETFNQSIVQNITPNRLGARELGASMGVAEELARRTGDEFEGPGRVMEQLTAPNLAANVARTLGQPGRDLARAAPEYVRGARATERLAAPDIAALKNPTVKDMAQAATTAGTYFKTKVLTDFVNKLFMPMATRREVLSLLSDPARAAEGVEALMRAQVRGDIPELSEEGLRRILNRTVGRGEIAGRAGMIAADDSYGEREFQGDTRPEVQRLTDLAMAEVNRGVWEMRGSNEPMSDDEFYAAEEMVRSLIEGGMSPEDAITQMLQIEARNPGGG